MRVPTVTELGQGVCALVALVGLFMLVPLPWFLLVAGVIGLALLSVVEHNKNLASAPPTESDGA